MSKKIPSQDFSYEFEVVFDKEKETTLQKIKRWINKKEPPLKTILTYLFSYVEKWYWEGKLKQTMSEVDSEVDKIHDVWDDELKTEQPIQLEEGVFGEDDWSISISNPVIGRGNDDSGRVMDIKSQEDQVK